MAIEIRNLEESDIEKAYSLFQQLASPDLARQIDLESFRASLMMDTCFSLIAEDEGILHGVVSVIMEQETFETVVGMMCHLWVLDQPERHEIAISLVSTALQSLEGNLQQCFTEIPPNALWAMGALEQAGFFPCGFLPHKFHGDPREHAMIYAFLTQTARNERRPHPEIIPSIATLASAILPTFGVIDDTEVRDDATAYSTENTYTFGPIEAIAAQTIMAGLKEQTSEIFLFLHLTQTQAYLPMDVSSYYACKDGDRVIGIIGYLFDPFDKKIQITQMISLEGEPHGFMAASLFEKLEEEHAPEYWEVLVNAHSPRMQKTFDQLGFVPCSYIPSFGMEHGMRSDAVKMVKFNVNYTTETLELTSMSQSLYDTIDIVFKEQSVGNAIIKLLQDLKIFQNMGEGELRKVAMLFSQKLFRPGEVLFEEGSAGREMYVIERGEIEIRTGDRLLGTLKSGTVIGEMAFLNGEPRTAQAVSKSATITRIIHRDDFDRLIQKESHLGLIFFKNVALDLAEKLKRSVIQTKKPS